MIGVEMVSDRGTKEPDGAFVGRLMAETQRRGLITVSCGMYHNVLRHLPPLVITDEQLDEALDVLADSALAARTRLTWTRTSDPSAIRSRTTPARRPARAGARGPVRLARPGGPRRARAGLFAAAHDGSDEAARMWTYLAYGPWPDEAAMRGWLETLARDRRIRCSSR